MQSLLGVHGKTGVTQISEHNGFIYTTGRSGNFQKYKYDERSNQLLLVDKQKARFVYFFSCRLFTQYFFLEFSVLLVCRVSWSRYGCCSSNWAMLRKDNKERYKERQGRMALAKELLPNFTSNNKRI